MGGLKVLLSTLALLGVPAHPMAADLLGPPPPLANGRAVAELGTGWYLRGDLGWVRYSDPGNLPFGGGLPFDQVDLKKSWSGGVGVGYQFASWQRADVTGDWRSEARFIGVNSGSNYVNGYSIDRGSIDSGTLLLNGYVDLGNWYGITPYVGAGVGWARNRFADYSAEVTCLTLLCGPLGQQPATSLPSHTSTTLAWALMGGVAVDLAYGFKLDFGYRYVRIGEARTGLDAFGVGTKTRELDSQEVRLGVRYMID
jgi:opacity protein-like surface antigen